MSTRSHIRVKNSDSLLKINTQYVYHHHDGYPEGVGKELKEYIPQFIKLVKDGELKLDSVEFCNFLEDSDSSYEYENYGIHGDEDYVYDITIDRKGFIMIECKEYPGETLIPNFSQVFNIEGSTTNTPKDPEIGKLSKVVASVLIDFLRSEEGNTLLEEALKKYFDKK